ncbi:ATP-binding protein [Streptomyces sp. ID05-39B]|uniref:sensor histidine kinase n=1 Tax=Streptomyces sp. ID05-39B TaxID=3028664 RepID=UPI0029B41ACD|nr:ATP-binding protein [Streptomyces sp. ID05-39B]MDX3528060.1 ATP-binding protein [Streptomyces sp. ID05-39B]
MSAVTAATVAAAAALLGSLVASVLAALLARRSREQSHRFETEVLARLEIARRERDSGQSRIDSVIPYLVDEVPAEVSHRVVADLTDRLIISGDNARISIIGPRIDKSQLTKEIAHSLRTPLAQIEAAALYIESSGRNPEDAVRRIHNAVDICKCFISAYREQTSVEERSSGWSPASIGKSLQAAANFYADKEKKALNVTLADFPENFPGYSNSFSIAALLPLIENAVEASPTGGAIHISYSSSVEHHVIEIANQSATTFPDESLFERGFSTKSGHEGLGLSVTKRLIEDYANGSVSFATSETVVTFTVAIPSRRNDV